MIVTIFNCFFCAMTSYRSVVKSNSVENDCAAFLRDRNLTPCCEKNSLSRRPFDRTMSRTQKQLGKPRAHSCGVGLLRRARGGSIATTTFFIQTRIEAALVKSMMFEEFRDV